MFFYSLFFCPILNSYQVSNLTKITKQCLLKLCRPVFKSNIWMLLDPLYSLFLNAFWGCFFFFSLFLMEKDVKTPEKPLFIRKQCVKILFAGWNIQHLTNVAFSLLIEPKCIPINTHMLNLVKLLTRLISIAAFPFQCWGTSWAQTVWCWAWTSTGPWPFAGCPPVLRTGRWQKQLPAWRTLESFPDPSPCFGPQCSSVGTRRLDRWQGCPRPGWSPWSCSSGFQPLQPPWWTCSTGLSGWQPNEIKSWTTIVKDYIHFWNVQPFPAMVSLLF